LEDSFLKNSNYAITETFSHFFSALFLSVLEASSEFQIAATAFLVIVLTPVIQSTCFTHSVGVSVFFGASV
jgi:hypothetical protein